jgi:hypothetical protein
MWIASCNAGISNGRRPELEKRRLVICMTNNDIKEVSTEADIDVPVHRA